MTDFRRALPPGKAEAHDGPANGPARAHAVDPEPMITARELARRLHLDVATIYRMTARNEFPARAVWRPEQTRGVVRYDWALIRNPNSGGE